jgi:hypothetical protein
MFHPNSYKKFLCLHLQHDTGELSSVSARSGLGSLSSADTLFTSEVRGAGKNGGWSEESMQFYNHVYEVLEQQQARPGRKAFEEKVRRLIQQANQGGRKQKRGGIAVRNGIALLTQLVTTSST